ncbi:MAG: hypothetical protein LiPW39_190 [Parcubacteria group bacterium LiPW_39]|nr:MAG: hypothetical protein LiPW39_190 [Parcubacteria group bacterium LiPW_39]
MKPYVLKFIPKEDLGLFEKIKTAVTKMPDIDLGKDEEGEEIILSCHILARAVARLFSLKFVDGYFHPDHSHSWLLTPNGNIIDVYPVSVLGGPLFIHSSHSSPMRWLYKKENIFDGLFSKPSFRRSVRRVIKVLR